jgi:hypothetical protein
LITTALRPSGNERSFCHHDCCGIVVAPNDILCLKLAIVDGIGGGKEIDDDNNMPEKAIKVDLVWDGTELCTVGFLSKSIVAVEKDKARHIGKFVQVMEL